jgi:hypothetical protein
MKRSARNNQMGIRIALHSAFMFAVAVFSAASAHAGLTICNRFDRAISVAFALAAHDPGLPSQRHANFFGWYGVASGECRLVRHLYGDNSYGEVTNGLVKVENGIVRDANSAMYLFVRDDQGHVWNGNTTRVSSQRQGEAVGERRDDSGYVWPNTLNICSPTGHGSPDVASVDTLSSDTKCDPGSSAVPYFLINPRYAAEFTLDVR